MLSCTFDGTAIPSSKLLAIVFLSPGRVPPIVFPDESMAIPCSVLPALLPAVVIPIELPKIRLPVPVPATKIPLPEFAPIKLRWFALDPPTTVLEPLIITP